MTPVLPQLQEKDLIGIIAPAGNVSDPASYHQGVTILKKMGFEVYADQKKWPGEGFLSDTDEQRAKEFMSTWCNPEIKVIMALRGGYGSMRILDRLDFSKISTFQNLLVGFSDISILLNVIVQETGQVCLHGPVLSSLAKSDQSSIERFYYCLVDNQVKPLKEPVEILRATPPVSGKLLGGNLSSLVTLIGTRWDIDFEGGILFLEDVNEPLYRLDRLLTQFHLANKWHGIKGIVLGAFTDGFETLGVEHQRVQEFVWKRVLELVDEPHVPVWGNFPSGHVRRNISLPLGMKCTMNSDNGSLSFVPFGDGN